MIIEVVLKIAAPRPPIHLPPNPEKIVLNNGKVNISKYI
jgi:hypothetical protein